MKNSLFIIGLFCLVGCATESPSKEEITQAQKVGKSCTDGPAICRLVCGQVYPALQTLTENAILQRECMVSVNV